MDKKFYLQETIGGWRQVAAFSGTYEECKERYNEVINNGHYSVVAEEDYEVDYL